MVPYFDRLAPFLKIERVVSHQEVGTGHSCWYQYICRHLPGRLDRDGASDRLVNLYRLLTVNPRAFTVTVTWKRTASSRRGDDGSSHRFLHEHVDLASSALPPISSMGTAFRHGVFNPCHRRSCRCPGRFNGLAGRMCQFQAALAGESDLLTR